jgi:hypothetical protein
MAKMPFSVSQEKSIRIADIMLLDSCWRSWVLFDVCRHRDRLNILETLEAGALAPIQELADGMIISDPRVLVTDGNGKKFAAAQTFGRSRTDFGQSLFQRRLHARLGQQTTLSPESRRFLHNPVARRSGNGKFRTLMSGQNWLKPKVPNFACYLETRSPRGKVPNFNVPPQGGGGRGEGHRDPETSLLSQLPCDGRHRIHEFRWYNRDRATDCRPYQSGDHQDI